MTLTPTTLPWVLASSSSTRRAQLERLGVHLTTVSPEVDETPTPDETPSALVLRLSCAKARAVSKRFPAHRILAGDQVHSLQGGLQGKPHTTEAAVAYLMRCSGQSTTFYTGFCLLNTQTQHLQTTVVETMVQYRTFDRATAEAYVALDRPEQCAGGMKLEAHGMHLVERVLSDDPNAMLGVPILSFLSMCHNDGLTLLDTMQGFDQAGNKS